MSIEPFDQPCTEIQAELVRLACDAADAPSAELQAHLAECPACRAACEGSRELVGALRTALAPEPLPAALLKRIRTDVAAATRRRSGWRIWSMRAGAVAAAAAAIGLIVVPRAMRSPSPVDAWTPSAQDAAAIAQAYGLLSWENADSVEYVESQVRKAAETLEASTVGGSMPWGPDDDWDMPAADADTSAGPGERVHA